MMAKNRKRFIVELAASGVASLFTLPIIFPWTERTRNWIVLPIHYLGNRIALLIKSAVFPRGGLGGLGIFLIVYLALTWIFLWMVLFAVVRLVAGLIQRKKREA
jgi:hypothetical protein